METRANYIIVGIFTLAALAAAFGFVYWTARYGGTAETARLVIRIPGSAAGLDRGSFVRFNGVRIGEVREVFIDVNQPNVAIAEAEVARQTPVTASTRASLTVAGLTGQAELELKGGNPDEPNLFDLAEEQGTTVVIDAEPSAVTNILETVQDIAGRANNVLTSLEDFVRDARQPLVDTVRNAETFSKALADNADNIDAFLKSFDELSKTLTSVSGKLETTLDSATGLLDSVDRDKVRSIVDNADSFVQRLEAASGDFETIAGNVDKAASNLAALSEKAGGTFDKIDGALEGIEPETVSKALDDIAAASASARKAADDAASVSERIAGKGEDIDAIIANARSLTERLNAASARVDGVLAKVDTLLGAEGGGDLIAEARQTLTAFRDVAQTLNARIDRIGAGLEQFSGRGLQQFEDFVSESRRSIQRIERAISDFERNPQRVISGGEGQVRQFDGRTRR